MIHALIIILLCSTVLSENETTNRNARGFRDIPPFGHYPSYNIPNVHGPGTYAFGYEVEDVNTGNLQFRDEEKFGDGSVKGAYGVLMPNGEAIVTKYVADNFGYRTNIETHNLNEEIFNQYDTLLRPMPYSIQLPNLSNNQLQIQTDSSTNNGVFGWLNSLGSGISNAFRPPPQAIDATAQQQQGPGPLATLFRPITNLFSVRPNNVPNQVPNQAPPNNQGGVFNFFQNLPWPGSNNQNNPNYNNVEQFSALQQATEQLPVAPPPSVPTTDYWDYDIPIVRPLAVSSVKPQIVPGYDTSHNSYSNLLRIPPNPTTLMLTPEDQILLADPSLIPNPTDGWLKKQIKRRRLQQKIKKETKKEIKQSKKPIIITPPAQIITNLS